MKHQKRKQLNPSYLVLFALLLILVFIIKGTFFSYIEYSDIKEKVEIQNVDFKKGNYKKETLEERKKRIKSNKFYQEKLLDNYGLVKPGERVINLIK